MFGSETDHPLYMRPLQPAPHRSVLPPLRLHAVHPVPVQGMTNIYWPKRPDLCNKDGRVCIRQDESHHEVLMHGKKVGDLYYAGEMSLIITSPPGIPGLELRRVTA